MSKNTAPSLHQINNWEYKYETELTRRIDAVFDGGRHFPWINAAWAAMLIRQGIITDQHAATVAAVAKDHLVNPRPEYHGMRALEKIVMEEHGDAAGGNITIGRTCPSQSQTSAVRYHLLKTLCSTMDVMDVILDVAEENLDAVMPGYTHIRHAQPTTFGHYLLSVFDPLERSLSEIENGFHLMSLNELGCGALAGTSLPIDRDLVTDYLGLDGLIENTNDAVSYTDGYLTLVAALTNLNAVFSRFALDLNIWSSEEYGFLDVPWLRVDPSSSPDDVKWQSHTHSHFMPNKTNNCPTLERSRVAAAVLAGALSEVAAMGTRCPHADMHEMLHMFESTLRAIQTTHLYMHPYIPALAHMTVNRGRMLAAVKSGWSAATELGNRLVLDHGLDYRTAHDILNDFINASKEAGISAEAAHVEMFEAAAERIIGRRLGIPEETLRRSLDPEHFVRVTNSKGGVAPEETARMLAARRDAMTEVRQRHEARVEKLENARARLLEDLAAMAGG
jgi:argininosuccinate lyase